MGLTFAFHATHQMPIISPLPHELHIAIAEYAAADAILDANWHWVAELCLLSQVFLPPLAPVLYHTVFVRTSSLDSLYDHARNPYSWFSLHTRHLVIDPEVHTSNLFNATVSSLIMDSPHIETITGIGSDLMWAQHTQNKIARAIHYDTPIELVGEGPPPNVQEALLQPLGSLSRLTHLHLSVSFGFFGFGFWASFTPDECSITHLLLDINFNRNRVTPLRQFVAEWLRHSRLKRLLIRPSHELMSRAVRSRAGRPVLFQLLVDDLVLHCKDMNETRIWVEGHPNYELDVGRSKMYDIISGLELWYRGEQLYRPVRTSES